MNNYNVSTLIDGEIWSKKILARNKKKAISLFKNNLAMMFTPEFSNDQIKAILKVLTFKATNEKR